MAIDPRGINRELRGFLDLFRAKVGGRQPSKFEESIRAGIDIQPYVSSELLKIATAEDASAGSTDVVSVGPGSQEAWLLDSIHWTLSDTAGVPAQSSIGRADVDLGSLGSFTAGYLKLAGNDVTNNFAMVDRIKLSPHGSLLLPPGSSLDLQMLSTTHVVTITVSALYAELKI